MRISVCVTAIVAGGILLSSASAWGQQSEPSPAPQVSPEPIAPGEATKLPEVTVDTTAQKTKAPKKKQSSAQGVSSTQGTSAAAAKQGGGAGSKESAWGPVNGIVATRSATGTKTDTPLIETPQSVSVITADQIAQQGATSLSEAVRYTAGVLSQVYGTDSRFDWLVVRGFDSYLPGFFIDGMLARNNNSWAVWKVEPYGAERIEILKGPPSVLYGQANAGGMVNVVSKRPLEEPLNEVELRFGNHDRVEAAFDFSGPANENGTVLYRLTGLGLTTDSQVDYAEQKRVYIAPALTWKPDSGTKFTILSQYLKDDNVPDIGFSPAEGTLHPLDGKYISRSFFAGEPDYDTFEAEQWTIGYALEHRFDAIWQARQNLHYRENRVHYKTLFGSGLIDSHTLARSAFTSDESVQAFTVDNQLQADFVSGGMKHTVLAGVDYQHNHFEQRSGWGDGPPIDILDPVYGSTVDDPPLYADATTTLQQTGVYLQEQAKLDRWVFVLGGRYDWADTDVVDHLWGGTTDIKDEAFTWKGGILYHAANGLAPYYSYSESFFPTATLDAVTGEPFGPETGQAHEVGIKYEPVGMKALFTLAAFDIKRQNYISTDANFQPHSTGEIRSRGIEFEAKADLAAGLELVAAYTWQAEFDVTQSEDATEVGNRVPIVPFHLASVWLHYRLQDGLLKGVGFGGGVRYIGESYGDSENSADMKVPDFALFDGAIDYEMEGWRLALNVNNIADERTFTCWDSCYYGPGRSVLATIRRRW